jgi:hypothetical protein
MAGYNLNRGINKSWELNGLVGSNVYYMVAAIMFTFVLFVTLYLCHVSLVMSLIIGFTVGGALWAAVYRINAKYGEHGVMKAMARRSSPRLITNRQSRLFLHLNEDNKTSRK